MLKIYGIPNCDKMKKMFNQLKDSGFDFEFYNYKKNAPTSELIIRWKKHLNDWPVNKRGTTYRKVKELFEAGDEAEKIDLIIQNASMIKRPIIEHESTVVSIGDINSFDEFMKKKI